MPGRIFQRNEQNFISLIHCGLEACKPGHEFGGLRPYYLVHVILEGCGSFICEGRKWQLGKGDAFIIYPDIKHQYTADRRDPWKYCWLAFSTKTPGLFENEYLYYKEPLVHGLDTEHLSALMAGLLEKPRENNLTNSLLVQAKATQVLAEIFAKAHTKSSHVAETFQTVHSRQNLATRENHVKTMLSYIADLHRTQISVNDVIDYVGLERSYASRLFSKTMGLSILSHLSNQRLRSAEDYLSQGFSLKAAAYSAGFVSYASFLATYKKQYGKTPTS